ncbi:MAG: hypothetical protein COB02_13385 [Candidatus Cloacimonadota bacterium]|nr:MAG: hypothetical protein COB02_13385 [Candidatus Cloacimonadota bacterium]
MNKWIKIVLGICIVSSCNFALEENVEDMVFRIFGKQNEAFEQKLETALEMGTIQEEDLEEIITNAHTNSEQGSKSSPQKTSTTKFGYASDKKYVLDINAVSKCFKTLAIYTKKKNLAVVGEKYKKFFTRYGKPVKIIKEDGTKGRAESPFAQTKLSGIMMDYSKCLYSLAVIKKSLQKENSSEDENTFVEENEIEESEVVEDTEVSRRNERAAEE